LKTFTTQLKKRDFYKFDTGREQAHAKLEAVYDEIKEFEDKIVDYGYNAAKFGNAGLIDQPKKQVETIVNECGAMKVLWDQISKMQTLFNGYMDNSWANTKPFEMEDEVKKNQKSLKEMKVDKKSNAYLGINDEIKKWLIFLPLIAELRDDGMRERHWDSIRDKVGVKFADPQTLALRDIYNLNLNKFQEDVEEITE
jgi:dynein heavy chain, axonemal